MCLITTINNYMSENAIRHIIALCGTLVGVLIYISGYVSGIERWWWTAFGLIILYIIIYQLVEA